jgi:hypothetical protein
MLDDDDDDDDDADDDDGTVTLADPIEISSSSMHRSEFPTVEASPRCSSKGRCIHSAPSHGDDSCLDLSGAHTNTGIVQIVLFCGSSVKRQDLDGSN